MTWDMTWDMTCRITGVTNDMYIDDGISLPDMTLDMTWDVTCRDSATGMTNDMYIDDGITYILIPSRFIRTLWNVSDEGDMAVPRLEGE
jgi:hypothetical protein